MTPRRLIAMLAMAIAVQVAVFHLNYRDLLWLNGPVATLEAADEDTVRRTAHEALDRTHLTRNHLEALAVATARPDLLDEHVRTLERLRHDNPADRHIALRVADAYRRAGRYDEARALFTDLLEETRR